MEYTHNGHIIQEKSRIIGINFASEPATEHECGIYSIRKAFGLVDDYSVLGIGRKKIKSIPSDYEWYNNDGWQGIVYHPNISCFKTQFRSNVHGLWTAWDERYFAALSCDEKVIKKLSQIFKNFFNDGFITVGGRSLFLAPGLVIGLCSKLPSHVKEDWLKGDKEYVKLQEEANATGIYERLQNADKRCFALTPRYIDGKLMFWLNPIDQDIYNCGHFTVQDLDNWINNIGPVIK